MTIVIWILSGLASLAFLAAGGSKLAGAAPMVDAFAKLGVGQWFRYVTGLLELTGAVGLLAPKYRFYAALLLAAVMVGAVATHLFIIGKSPAGAALLLVLVSVIAWLSHPARV